MTIGQRIKERRISLGYSAEDVAKKLGKNRATIYRYESEEIENLPLSILEPLADVLKCSPAYLMGWENEPIGGKNTIIAAHRKNPFEDVTDEEEAALEAYLEILRKKTKK